MFSPHRARIIGTRHMAAAGQYLSAQAAFQILEAGGNAIDAGVAGGIALGVVQSEYVSFGGVAPIMIYLAKTSEVITISGLGYWPKATRLEVINYEHGGTIPAGLLQTVTPAAPDAWITALERYGTMSYGDVAQAALRFAREGFAVPSLMSKIITDLEHDYRRWPQNASIYMPKGRPPLPGERLVQSDLATTIQYMIDEERSAAAKGGRIAGLRAAHDAFYRGDIAKRIVQYHRENGGWFREEDLAEFRSEVAPALKTTFQDIDFYFCGPWCQGPVLGQTLNVLNGMDIKSMGHNSPAYVHVITEAFKLAYADRHELYGDPNFVPVPIWELMSAEYAARRRREINPGKAHPGMPASGLPSRWGQVPAKATPAALEKTQLDTSFICVVDRHGNAFAATPSDGSGESPIIPGLGFAPSSRGTQSWTNPGAPAVLGPGRRPRLTPAPALARKPGEWIMPFGSPGNDVQPQAMLQVFLNMHVWGMTPQAAIDEPRFATFSYPRSSAPHPYQPGLLNLENRLPQSTLDSLRALGHRAEFWPDWTMLAGGVCAIFADERTGMMEGGSDPRRPTGIAGW